MTGTNFYEWIERWLNSQRAREYDLETNSLRVANGLIHGDQLDPDESLTIEADEGFVTTGSFTITGDATIDGDLVTVSNRDSHDQLADIDPTDHLNVVQEYQITANSGSQPAFDSELTNAFADELDAFDVTVAPTTGLDDTYGFNFDSGKHWNNGSWDVPLTINWDDDPGEDLGLTVRVHRRT